jgi:hypothetical protein
VSGGPRIGEFLLQPVGARDIARHQPGHGGFEQIAVRSAREAIRVPLIRLQIQVFGLAQTATEEIEIA